MRFLRAWFDARAAELERWAAETRELAKRTPEREYWRGYADGMRDRKGRAMPDPYTDEALYGRRERDCDGCTDQPHACDLHRQA